MIRLVVTGAEVEFAKKPVSEEGPLPEVGEMAVHARFRGCDVPDSVPPHAVVRGVADDRPERWTIWWSNGVRDAVFRMNLPPLPPEDFPGGLCGVPGPPLLTSHDQWWPKRVLCTLQKGHPEKTEHQYHADGRLVVGWRGGFHGLLPEAVAAGTEKRMRRVIIESPFAGLSPEDRQGNIDYLRRCLRDCLLRGEAPFASHAIYTQDGVLDDDVAAERALGIEAGLVWGAQAEATVVYLDRGLSTGMKLGIERAKTEGRPVEERLLNAGGRVLAAPSVEEEVKG